MRQIIGCLKERHVQHTKYNSQNFSKTTKLYWSFPPYTGLRAKVRHLCCIKPAYIIRRGLVEQIPIVMLMWMISSFNSNAQREDL